MSKGKVTLTIDEDVVEALYKKAESEARSRSAMANLILKKALLDDLNRSAIPPYILY